jgi:hypothetical protein
MGKAVCAAAMFLLATAARGEPGGAAVAPAPGYATSTVLPQPSSTCVEAPTASRWLRAGRISLEVVLGLGLGAVTEVAGAYVGLNLDVMAGREASAGTVLGLTLGAILGVGPSVWLAGYAMSGDGSFGWTVLGGTLGTALAGVLLALSNSLPMLVVAATVTVAGSIAGYELSSHRRRQRPAESLALFPSLGPRSLGIAGVF